MTEKTSKNRKEILLGRNFRLVLERARERAGEFGHRHIDTEHLLLGLIPDLDKIEGLSRPDLPESIQLILDLMLIKSQATIDRQKPIQDILSKKAKKVILQAIEFARVEGADELTPKHLLKSLIHQEDCYAGGVLRILNVVVST